MAALGPVCYPVQKMSRYYCGVFHKFVYCIIVSTVLLAFENTHTNNSDHLASCESQIAMLSHQKNGDHDKKRRWRLLPEPQ